jgi:hypothetical protein
LPFCYLLIDFGAETKKNPVFAKTGRKFITAGYIKHVILALIHILGRQKLFTPCGTCCLRLGL